MPAGRPLKFKNVKELQERIDAYFARCKEDEEPLTITGLALELDTDRVTLCRYELKDEYSNAIKKAKLRVEMDYELALRRRGSSGDIFGLKNFGWSDKQEIEQSGETKQDITIRWADE